MTRRAKAALLLGPLGAWLLLVAGWNIHAYRSELLDLAIRGIDRLRR